MSSPKLPRNHDPRAFTLSLLREDDCCKLILPGLTVEAHPYFMWNSPLKDFMDAVCHLHTRPLLRGFEKGEFLKFDWDMEGSEYSWKYRPLKDTPWFRLRVVHYCSPEPQTLVDTVLDSMEFARQVWREAHHQLRVGGLALFYSDDGYNAFPFGDFVRLHHIVTGEPIPKTLSEEIALLTRLATEAPPQA